MKPKFYLAHSCLCHKKIRKWQLLMEAQCNISFSNPFSDNREEDISVVKDTKTLNKLLNELSWEQCATIMVNDLELIRKSDGIVAYFESPTIGTCMEIFVAAYIYHIPVYVITKKYANHPWIRALATEIFPHRTALKQFLLNTFGER